MWIETTLHVVPLFDLIEHEEAGTDCPCGPSLEYLIGEAGTGTLITHFSLDGRERLDATPPAPH